MLIAGGVGLILLTIGFSYLFGGATVRVSAHVQPVKVDALSFQAKKDASTGLSFEVETVERSGVRQVTPTGEENVSIKATGRIVVYNNYATQGQRLIKNTRFETGSGLIYRIPESITVPGIHKENGQNVPGSIEVDVVADQPGDPYNISLSDFTIPGFKGTPQYDKFYARSKTPITGGFVGKRPVVPTADLVQIRTDLEKELRGQLLTQAQAQKPAGYLLYESGATATFELQPTTESNGQAVVTEKATLSAIILRAEAFASTIAKGTVAQYEDEPVQLDNPEELTVVFTGASNPLEESVTGTISGNARIRYTFDPAALQQNLAGKAKEALSTLVNNDPAFKNAISKATVSIRPFWKGHFPVNPKGIRIITEN